MPLKRLVVPFVAAVLLVSVIEASLAAKPTPTPTKCPLLGDASAARYDAQSNDALNSACNRDDLDACVFLGLRLLQPMVGLNGEAPPQALAAALAAFDKACAAGRGNACSNLSGMHKNGWGVAPSASTAEALKEKACVLFEKGCAARCAEDCSLLAFRCVSPWNTKRTPEIDAKFADLTARACDYGDASSCGSAARHYGNLEGDSSIAHPDLKRATTLLAKGCDGGQRSACVALGRVYERGAGAFHDAQKATAAYRRACDGVATCSAQHDMILKAACKTDVAKGCCGLARVVEATKGPAAATEFFQRATDADGGRSCPEARRPSAP